jgi:uncharacterized protein YutE (UPF0331/DUF86 family)
MTPGRIDLKIVTDRLAIVDAAVDELHGLPATSVNDFTADRRNIWASDALLRRAIEALFDAARHLLARAHGRGGLEYRDVARMASDKGLIPAGHLSERMLKIAGFRNRLAHYYDEVTPAELYAVVSGELGDLTALTSALRASAARLAGDDTLPSQ